MSFLGKGEGLIKKSRPSNVWPSEESNWRLLSWLVSLQTSVIQEEDVSAPDQMENQPTPDTDESCDERASEQATVVSPEDTVSDMPGVEPLAEDLSWAGMTGRCNKVADTCYAFWAGGSLTMMNSLHLLDMPALRRYLLEKTQHRIGGFGKLPGDVPDIMHSCLGLAGLAVMGEPGLKTLDPSLCLSVEARERLENLPWRQRPQTVQVP
ncbi:MAG: hypothetical protein Q9183_003030 [Haloplaca sp. 2 TL-2023]